MQDLFRGNFEQRDREMQQLLNVGECFDILRRHFEIGGRQAAIYTIDGLLNGQLAEKVMEFFYSVKEEDMPKDIAGFLQTKMPYVDILKVEDQETLVWAVLSGMSLLMIDGYDLILSMDFRDYPNRSVDEPDKDKVIRGSRDGFIESLMSNIALVRRRIRDVNLIFQAERIGRASKTDLAVCYMKDRVRPEVLDQLLRRLKDIDVDALTMNQESLAESIFPKGWLNPFPKFKFTERPDTTAACLLEGSIVILCDNSSAAMIIPSSLFEIIEDPNDYYFPPITGTYLRLSRLAVNVLAVFLTPVFLLLLRNPDWIPAGLAFIRLEDNVNIPLLVQFLILEVAIDGLRMAAVNTPNMLNTPLSIVAGIVLGDYTVETGWFNEQVIFYMAFVAVANYTQSNMELGYALKFMRIQLLLLTGIFGIWGFVAGTAVALLTPVCTRTVTGRNYLYPLIPFDGKQLLKNMFRISLYRNTKLKK